MLRSPPGPGSPPTLYEPGRLAADGTSGPSDETPEPRDAADDEVYQGNVVVSVDTDGSAKRMIHFLNEVGVHSEIRLLQLMGGPREVTVLLGLRRPLALKELFSRMNGVSEVRPLSSGGPGRPDHVLHVALS